MPAYRPPGVYIEEAPSGARPIAAVATANAAFFGVAPGCGAPERTPVAVTSYLEFVRIFAEDAKVSTSLLRAAAGFFENGGSRLHVINLGGDATQVGPRDLALIEAIEDVSLLAAPGFVDARTHDALIDACEVRDDWFAVLDCPSVVGAAKELARPAAEGGLRPRSSARGVAAFYAPWIVTVDPLNKAWTPTPPSGHVCGLYARIDATRGIHVAPANQRLVGAVDLAGDFSQDEMDRIGIAGVNCIRRFGTEMKVWGARTLADPPSEWLYVPVRRLLNMIVVSIVRGSQWVGFEPNGEPLWGALRAGIDAFLNGLWRQGALQGVRPEEAWFVRCDMTTMTQADLDTGRVVILIGVAPIRPAEFILQRIGLQAGPQ